MRRVFEGIFSIWNKYKDFNQKTIYLHQIWTIYLCDTPLSNYSIKPPLASMTASMLVRNLRQAEIKWS